MLPKACAPIALAILAVACRQPRSGGDTLWITTSGLRLKTEIFQSAKRSDHPILILVIHGDSPFTPPSYQYTFARNAAGQLDDAVVAALLRPGYTDAEGDQSAGVRGLTTGDNYTPQVVDAVADVANQLRNRFSSRAVLLVGHSGGAAIAADVLGRHRSAVDGALLVSCPCDLAAWRQHMFEAQKGPAWLAPVHSLSPLDLAGSVSPSTRVRMLVGSRDIIAPPALTETYAAALRARGVDVKTTVAPNLPHDILLEPVAYEELKSLVLAIKR